MMSFAGSEDDRFCAGYEVCKNELPDTEVSQPCFDAIFSMPDLPEEWISGCECIGDHAPLPALICPACKATLLDGLLPRCRPPARCRFGRLMTYVHTKYHVSNFTAKADYSADAHSDLVEHAEGCNTFAGELAQNGVVLPPIAARCSAESTCHTTEEGTTCQDSECNLMRLLEVLRGVDDGTAVATPEHVSLLLNCSETHDQTQAARVERACPARGCYEHSEPGSCPAGLCSWRDEIVEQPAAMEGPLTLAPATDGDRAGWQITVTIPPGGSPPGPMQLHSGKIILYDPQSKVISVEWEDAGNPPLTVAGTEYTLSLREGCEDSSGLDAPAGTGDPGGTGDGSNGGGTTAPAGTPCTAAGNECATGEICDQGVCAADPGAGGGGGGGTGGNPCDQFSDSTPCCYTPWDGEVCVTEHGSQSACEGDGADNEWGYGVWCPGDSGGGGDTGGDTGGGTGGGTGGDTGGGTGGGTAPAGTACGADNECASGEICDQGMCADADGCAAIPSPGFDAVAGNADDDQGPCFGTDSICVDVVAPGVGNTCQCSPSFSGADVTSDQTLTTCSPTNPCAVQGSCTPSGGGDTGGGTGGGTAPAGTACGADNECASGEICNDGFCAADPGAGGGTDGGPAGEPGDGRR